MDVPRRLGRYEIIREIGRGGMGTVYLARDPMLARELTLKVLAPELVLDPSFAERFFREARAAAKLRHPNIITIYDFGQDAEQLYIAMEYLPGGALSQLLRTEAALSLRYALDILAQVADALDYAHAQGVLHRDVKPGNILIEERLGKSRVVLTDFGLARILQDVDLSLTATGAIVGTPSYMAPEQAQGSAVGPASDLYALGIVAYQMLTGYLPFSATTPIQVALLHANEPPPPPTSLNPELPSRIEPVLLKALAKNPADRFNTATKFVEALARSVDTSEKLVLEPVISLPAVTDDQTMVWEEAPPRRPPFFARVLEGMGLLLSRAQSVVLAGWGALLAGVQFLRARISRPAPPQPRETAPSPPLAKPMPAVPPSLVKNKAPP